MQAFKRNGVLILACVAIAFGVFAGVSAIVSKGQATCEAENKNNQTLVGLLDFFEGQTLRNPHITPAKSKAIVDFYNKAIDSLPKQQKCD